MENKKQTVVLGSLFFGVYFYNVLKEFKELDG